MLFTFGSFGMKLWATCIFVCVSFLCLSFLFVFFVTLYALFLALFLPQTTKSSVGIVYLDVLGVITLGTFSELSLSMFKNITSGQLFYLGHIKPKILYLCFLHLMPSSVLMQLAMPLKHFCYRYWTRRSFTHSHFKILLNLLLSPMD